MTDTELEINRKGKLESFRRDEVKKVWLVVSPSNRAGFQTIGWISGFLAGTMNLLELGFKDCGGACGDEKAGIAAAFIGLPIIGLFVWESSGWEGQTYRWSTPAP